MIAKKVILLSLASLGALACSQRSSVRESSWHQPYEPVVVRVWHAFGSTGYRFESRKGVIQPLFAYDNPDATVCFEPWPSGKEYIDFNATDLGKDIGYVYFRTFYAVTTDGGLHWATTDFSRLLGSTGDAAVTRIVLNRDGTGLVEAFSLPLSRDDALSLRDNSSPSSIRPTAFNTADFGRTWRVANGA